MPTCPLCSDNSIKLFFADENRRFLQCTHCLLVFVPQEYWLTRAEEKATYDLHENDVKDPGYRRFLSRLTEPLVKKLAANKKGLDFGCGPGPALSDLLAEQGHQVDLFDPHYHNNRLVFDNSYDFICATEVVEHLHNPNKEFTTLFSLLKSGGWLGIMTKLVLDKQAFSNWHYIRDLTHICFYSQSTFAFLAQRFDAELSFAEKDVIFLRKR